MTPVPNTVFSQYETILKSREVPLNCYTDYKKWLRYYLDFCAKYPVPDSKSERVQLFSEKLRGKKQTEQQRQQAMHAVFMYFEMQNEGAHNCKSIKTMVPGLQYCNLIVRKTVESASKMQICFYKLNLH
jgi:hypothetical protein